MNREQCILCLHQTEDQEQHRTGSLLKDQQQQSLSAQQFLVIQALPGRTFFKYLVFLYMTIPSFSANSVWSLPQPTKSPGWNCDHSTSHEVQHVRS